MTRRASTRSPRSERVPNMSGDRVVMYQLMKRVNAMPNGTTRAFRLKVNFHGPYTMKLIVEKSRDGYLSMTINENMCVYLTYSEYSEPHFRSQIYADTADRRCFDPAPNTSRFRMLDFLTVLLTKLMIAIIAFGPREATNTATNGANSNFNGEANMYGVPKSKITLNDIAKKEDVALTPYKILRGGQGIYERYGYYSDDLMHIYEALGSLTVDNLEYDVRGDLATILKKGLKGYELVKPLMQGVSWDAEKDYHVSERIVEELMPATHGPADERAITMFLNEKSSEWVHWDAQMQLVGVGRWGSRHTRRRRLS